MIEEFIDLKAGWCCFPRNHESLLHLPDDVDCRGIPVLDDAEQDGAAAVFPDDVLLHQIAVADVTHVLQENRGAAREFDRNIVEIIDRRRRRIRPDAVLFVADLRRARRQGDVLSIDGIDDVERRKPFGEKLGRINIYHDLPVLPASGGGEREPVNGCQSLPQPVYAVIIELLFVERVGAQADLQDRHAGRIVLHHDRGLDARRHERPDRIRA